MNLILKGYLTEVSEVETITSLETNKKSTVFKVLITVPGYHDGFQKVGQDEVFEAQVFNEKITHASAKAFLTKKVTAKCYLNSKQSDKSGTAKYFLSLNLASIEVL
jgi:hypothetical protein